MTKRTIHAQLPDGSTGKRSTDRLYTHAIAVERNSADTYERITNRLANQRAKLAGCEAKLAEVRPAEPTVREALDFQVAEHNLGYYIKAVAKEQKALAATSPTGTYWEVLSWHTRLDLAEKATATAQANQIKWNLPALTLTIVEVLG